MKNKLYSTVKKNLNNTYQLATALINPDEEKPKKKLQAN